MTLYEFIAADATTKANDAVWNGTLPTSRECNNEIMLLYNLGSFFVELVYDIGTTEIVRFTPFRSRRLLEPYLDNLVIEDWL